MADVYQGGAIAGVSSLGADANPKLDGDVTLEAGANVTLTQVGQTISIASSAGGTPPSTETPNPVGATPSAGIGTDPSAWDHVHEGLHSIAAAGETPLLGDVELVAGSNVTLTQAANQITISSSGGGGGGDPTAFMQHVLNGPEDVIALQTTVTVSRTPTPPRRPSATATWPGAFFTSEQLWDSDNAYLFDDDVAM